MKHLFYSLRYKIAAALVNYLRPRLKPWLDASVDTMLESNRPAEPLAPTFEADGDVHNGRVF